jgi:hypothetical protein
VKAEDFIGSRDGLRINKLQLWESFKIYKFLSTKPCVRIRIDLKMPDLDLQ